ncbi:MAG: SCO family protein [Proteobacteria bacterium]|nr:SCO family protein [Pseudomonadota bacterium]
MRVTAMLAAVLVVTAVCLGVSAWAATPIGPGAEAVDSGASEKSGSALVKGGMDQGDMDMNGLDMKGVPVAVQALPAMTQDQPGAMPVMAHDHEAIRKKAELEGPPVGVAEHLGAFLPDDAWFMDSDGKRVNLRQLVGNTPTILLPVYYSCPNVCHILQSSFARVLPQVNLVPGEEIQVISLSFDERDSVRSAANSKRQFAMALEGRFPPEHWHFLAGDKQNIDRAMEAVGFRFMRVDQDFAHPVVVIALAPGGKVVRYLYGTDFLPFDVTMAATEAAEGKTGLSVKRMLSYCFSYDPEGRRYTFDLMRVAGVSILGFIAIMLAILFAVGKKKKRP